MTAPILYAFTLGMIAALNPCGFPLLPAYLTVFLGRADGGNFRSRTASALIAGACVTLGIVIAFCGIGVLAQIGMLVLAPWTLVLTVCVGVIFLVLGVMGLIGHAPTLSVRAPSFAPGRSAVAMTGFGVAFALSSLSCALPLFLAAVASSFGRLGVMDGLAIFLSYALGMGIFFTGVSFGAAHLGVPVVRRLRKLSRFVPIVANVLLSVVGAYVALSATLALSDNSTTPGFIVDVDAVASSVSQWLASTALMIGSVLLTIVLVSIALLASTAHRAQNHSDDRG